MLQKKSSTRTSPTITDSLLTERLQTRGDALILVAEDDDDNRLMLKTLLEMKGYRVSEARNGQEAIASAQGEQPDLILMDLQLPLLNGFAVARFIRHDDALRKVPIIIVSGHDPAKHRKLALAAGCNDYMHKPIDFEHLQELLGNLIPASGGN